MPNCVIHSIKITNCFFFLFPSQNGNYLCSQAGEPDNTLTIWDWKKSEIVLRTKSHAHNVYTCRFSTFEPDRLVTAGSGHVKFWKMATTFTGLKFQGRLGRFGKTEVSDVVGTFSMPDEKVNIRYTRTSQNLFLFTYHTPRKLVSNKITIRIISVT